MKTNAQISAAVKALLSSSPLGELFLFEGHAVRVVGTADNPLFVAADVCDVLAYENSRKALADHVDDDERSDVTIGYTRSKGDSTQNRAMACVTESGLYALIFKSRKPEAIRFRRWVTGEVLPALRKQGFYAREGMDARLARIERARALRAQKSALLAEARALAAEIERLEELGDDAVTVTQELGATATLSQINRVLAYARRHGVPVGRREGHTIIPRSAIRAALDLNQSTLGLN